MLTDRLEAFRPFIEEAIPFNRVLGLRLEEARDGRARIRLQFKPELVGNFRTQVLHGGVIAATLDVVGACAVMSTFEDEVPPYGMGTVGMGTVDMRVDYLSPGAGGYFIATGQLMRPGQILSAARMELYNDQEQMIAMGSAVYRVSRKAQAAQPNL